MYNNLAFRIQEPQDGTHLVIFEDQSLGEEDCPRVIWRDDDRGARFGHGRTNDKARWFKNDGCYDPDTWAGVMVKAVRVYGVGMVPVAEIPPGTPRQVPGD